MVWWIFGRLWMQPGNFRTTVWWIVGVLNFYTTVSWIFGVLASLTENSTRRYGGFLCFCIARAKKIHDGMVDCWSSFDASGKFNHDGMMDFWCSKFLHDAMVDFWRFGMAHAKKVHDGMVDCWSFFVALTCIHW